VLRYPEVEYFVRLKRIFKMTWDPVTALRRDIQGNSVAQGAVSVVLAVSVNKEGSLDELFVLRSSGMGNYDQEALRTVRASSPFAAPPTKFLEKDGLLRMSWTFVVYM
jgi:TonB family protein